MVKREFGRVRRDHQPLPSPPQTGRRLPAGPRRCSGTQPFLAICTNNNGSAVSTQRGTEFEPG
jgi:hypothetical protein